MSRPAVFFLTLVAPGLAILLAWLGLATVASNPLGWFLFLTGIVYGVGTVLYVIVRRERFWDAERGEGRVQEERGDRSFWLITLGMMAVFYLSPLEYSYWAAWLPCSVWLKWCGLGLVLCGSALFVWARRTLRGSYSGHVAVRAGQELVQSGPYGIIRHPAYEGFLLMALGISLGYCSLLGLAALMAVLIPAVVYRIRVEERVLAVQCGEQWRAYSKRVPALLPRLRGHGPEPAQRK